MTLEKYLTALNELVQNDPELLKCIVVYAKDDEGNAFNPVEYEPTIGYYHEDGTFETGTGGDDPNALCIN